MGESNTPSVRLSPKQQEALSIIARYGIRYTNDPDVYAVVTTGETAVYDEQPWINWRTADALERKGFGKVDGYGEETQFILANGARFDG